jgi:hypothetical protein
MEMSTVYTVTLASGLDLSVPLEVSLGHIFICGKIVSLLLTLGALALLDGVWG